MLQKGVTLWFTGLSGSGKTTVAVEIERILQEKGCAVERLDGDVVREHLTRDLGFSREDREENIHRVSFLAKLLTLNGVITLCSFISPYRKSRKKARELISDFVEIYVNAPLDVCEKRDVKGLYGKAREGDIPEFTGVSDPYEPPEKPELELKTEFETVEESAEKVIGYLEAYGYISKDEADLHLHTTASDGNLEPESLVRSAKEAGFSAIAVTDHDSTEGIKEALQAAVKFGLEVIPGIELSTLDGKKEIHMLGYYINPDNEELQIILARVIDARQNRALYMIEKLNELGIHITKDEVETIAGGEFVGRPHIARAMVDKGYIKNETEAFSAEYIGREGKAYVERFKISPRESIELIKKAGGLAVLAHPGYLSDRTMLEEEEVIKYKEWGLDGIEVFYSRHTLQQVDYYKTLANKLDLLITGGSDCHGGKEYLMGCVRLPYYYVKELKDARI